MKASELTEKHFQKFLSTYEKELVRIALERAAANPRKSVYDAIVDYPQDAYDYEDFIEIFGVDVGLTWCNMPDAPKKKAEDLTIKEAREMAKKHIAFWHDELRETLAWRLEDEEARQAALRNRSNARH